ncbi:MAG TPA: NAD(P)-dependent oxidoreductase [Thermoanaerobaculia bacterium]|nr:NAD(P)-dependent oxidoreductase [Thermoanaerobaculia bacterium]
MPKTLLVAADVDRSLLERARADDRFAVVHQPVRTEDELAAIIGDAEVLVTRAYNRVTRRVLEAAPRLELIAQGTSGIDNIDADAARERGVTIVNLPGANANAVAELVIGFILAMTRTVPFYTREVSQGQFERDDCATRHEMRHHHLGIVGLGQVGKRVARLACVFGMHVRAFDPYIDEFGVAERVDSLAALLAASDVLTLHVPLTNETRKMIGANEIASLKRGSYLINASRGEVLDQNAALRALEEGQLAGLALDVFDPEPPAGGFPDDPRLILTPHVAGCSFECKADIGALLYEKIVAFYAGGGTPPGQPARTPAFR